MSQKYSKFLNGNNLLINFWLYKMKSKTKVITLKSTLTVENTCKDIMKPILKLKLTLTSNLH